MISKLLTVTNCTQCPNSYKKRTPRSGYAEDYWCKAVTPNRIYAGYIEWDSELPKNGEFPDWCPLPTTESMV